MRQLALILLLLLTIAAFLLGCAWMGGWLSSPRRAVEGFFHWIGTLGLLVALSATRLR